MLGGDRRPRWLDCSNVFGCVKPRETGEKCTLRSFKVSTLGVSTAGGSVSFPRSGPRFPRSGVVAGFHGRGWRRALPAVEPVERRQGGRWSSPSSPARGRARRAPPGWSVVEPVEPCPWSSPSSPARGRARRAPPGRSVVERRQGGRWSSAARVVGGRARRALPAVEPVERRQGGRWSSPSSPARGRNAAAAAGPMGSAAAAGSVLRIGDQCAG